MLSLCQTMDRMKDRYGFDAVMRCAGATFKPNNKAKFKRNINTMYLNCHSFTPCATAPFR
jgi:hypothetical protein